VKRFYLLGLGSILIFDQIVSQQNPHQNRRSPNRSADVEFSIKKNTTQDNKNAVAAQVLDSSDIQRAHTSTSEAGTVGLGPALITIEMTNEIQKGNFAMALAIANDFINSHTNILSTLSENNFQEYLVNDEIKLRWLEAWKLTAKINDVLILMGQCASKLNKKQIALVYYYLAGDDEEILAILKLFATGEIIKKEETMHLFMFALKSKNYEPARKLFCNTGKCFYIEGGQLFIRLFFCISFPLYYLFIICGLVSLVLGYFYFKKKGATKTRTKRQ
jgi:hypothetical protein